MTSLLHANSFELDAAPGLARPAGNNPSLFSILDSNGYHTEFLGVSAFNIGPMLPLLAGSLPPVWTTDDFAELLAKFETAIAQRPFALYVWNLVTHIAHAIALESFSDSIDDLVGGACAVADRIVGDLFDLLERHGVLDETVLVMFGDHGDDYWTHGFKRGALHGSEPYSHVTHAPLFIRDPALAAVDDYRMASTIDLAPTCLDLLGIAAALPFSESGISLAAGGRQAICFSQNFTANQPDSPHRDVRKAFCVYDTSYALMVSSRGLELFNHKLDPTNHCNLLHLFELVDDELALRVPGEDLGVHLATLLEHMTSGERAVSRRFKKLQRELREYISKKNRYVAEHAQPPFKMLDPSALDTINRHGRSAYFGALDDADGQSAPTAAGAPRDTRTGLRGIKDVLLGRSRNAGR
ncbi:MAG: sulfatase-like hydrolase/transferase [Rhodospirillaceae bacterium]|nr:sulfatase-like hydrolase/transferase [Rhodospirillaceae bacterium]